MRTFFLMVMLAVLGSWTAWSQGRPRTAQVVDVTVEFATAPPPPHAGAILYDRNRPLQLDDFRGIPDDPRAVAATHSSLGMGYRAVTRGNRLDLRVTITAYMDPELSWCRPNARTERVLDHEQLHFDITGLAACNLREAIEAARLTPSNYKAELRRIQDEWNNWWRAKEEQYDAETEHGTIKERQRAWADAIREQVDLQPCFLLTEDRLGLR